MRNHILVCPFDENLIRKFHNQRLVIILSDFDQIQNAHKLVNECQNSLHCLVIYHNGSLASVPFHETWKGIPLALFVSEIGAFKEFMGRLPLLRDLNIRIFLSTDNKENYTSLHILASLGIDCGINFGEKEIDWEAMNDLMTYSIYGKVNHASIEPFQFIAGNYDPSRINDFSSVYFDNPQSYLHIDKDENIALTAKDMQDGKFILKGIENICKIFEDEKYEEAINAWQEFFLKENGCAYCQAWRICIGKFSVSADENPGCRQFFTDLMEASDHFISVQHKNKRKEVWQP